MTISILKAERFYPLGKPIQRPAKDDSKKDGEQVRPGIWRKPDGTMETRGYEPPKPTMKPADPEPAKAEAAALGDGWIAWGGGECPIRGVMAGEWVCKYRNGVVSSACKLETPERFHWRHRDSIGDIVAYRLIPTEAA